MILKIGSKGSEVKTIQEYLHLLPDGIYGSLTEEAVKEFQKNNGLNVTGIVDDATFNKIKGSNLIKSKRIINEIIIHCSATVEGKDYTTEDIKKWHRARGFSDIGYHYIIYRDGSIHNGRNVNISGAHCTNHNAHSIGICYIGGVDKYNKPKDTRTLEQKNSLKNLLLKLKVLYPKATIHGHNEYANKACPCFNVKKEYLNIK